MSEKPNSPESNEELSDEQLEEVNGGIIINGRFAHLPAVQGESGSDKHQDSIELVSWSF